jgi:hypothetical protein
MDDFVLATTLIEHPDFSASDQRAEIEALFARQYLIDAIAHGEAHLEELMELFVDQGHDPEEYLAQVDENLTIFFDSNPVVGGDLYLPLIC